MLRPASRLTLSVFLLLPLAFSGGCSRQQEGERCSLSNGNDDCDGTNLVCTNATLLRKGADGVDRCCPENLESTTVAECARRTGSGDDSGDGNGGAGGESGGGIGGDLGIGDPPDLGDGCRYDSQCSQPLVCGPGGVCQYECNEDRDCPEGQSCNVDRSCE